LVVQHSVDAAVGVVEAGVGPGAAAVRTAALVAIERAAATNPVREGQRR